VTTAETSQSQGRSEAAEPGRRGLQRTLAWLPTWDLITTKNLELRKRRGLMITMVVLIVLPAVLILGLRPAVPRRSIRTPTPRPAARGVFSGLGNLIAEFGFIAAAALGAPAGTTDLSDGMFRHLVITGRSRLALYLARIPASLAITVPLVALAFTMTCLVTSYEGSPNPTSVPLFGLNVPEHLDQAELQTWLLQRPQQDANTGLPLGRGLPVGPGATAAQIRSSIDKNIAISVYSVAFAPNGHMLASGDDSGTIRLWDVTDPAHPRPLSQSQTNAGIAYSVAFSMCGNWPARQFR
jgi:hypothetical protein